MDAGQDELAVGVDNDGDEEAEEDNRLTANVEEDGRDDEFDADTVDGGKYRAEYDDGDKTTTVSIGI
jgi:hypothetical protein